MLTPITEPRQQSSSRGLYDTFTGSLRMARQAALRTSRGTLWLVAGGILAAISITQFAFLVDTPGGGVAVVVIGIETAIFLGMIVVRFAVPTRTRVTVLAAGMIAIAIVAVLALIIVVGAAVSPF